MARIRTIKPGFFTSLTITQIPRDVRLTFIGLWTHCDDDGRCIADGRLIKAAVWPLDDDVTADVVEGHLSQLADRGLVELYRVNGRRYLQVAAWGEHQKISHPKASELPSLVDAEPPPEPSVNPPEALRPEVEVDREQGREQGEHGADAPSNVVDVFTGGFPTRTGDSTLAAAVVAFADSQGREFPAPSQLSHVYEACLEMAGEHLGPGHPSFRRVSEQLCGEYVTAVVGEPLTPGAKGHLARLIGEFGAHGALRGLTAAVSSGAGLKDEHAKDVLALTKYANAVLRGEARTA